MLQSPTVTNQIFKRSGRHKTGSCHAAQKMPKRPTIDHVCFRRVGTQPNLTSFASMVSSGRSALSGGARHHA